MAARLLRTARALAAACHPGPTVAVTALSAVLARTAGLPRGKAAAVAGAVLAGQLSIGWSNDLLDAARDRRAGRRGKPVASGALPVGVASVATATALGACTALSLAAGARPGGLHLAAVSGGWAYNLGLKATPASVLPYAVSFGLLPAFVVGAAGGRAPWWLVGSGSLLGSGAHFLNALPDLADDRAAGVDSLPVRLGRGRAQLAGAALLAAPAVLLATAPRRGSARAGGGHTGVGGRAAGAVTARTAAGGTVTGGTVTAGALAAGALAAAAAVPTPDPRSRRPFALAVAVAALDVALLARASGIISPAPGSLRPARRPRPHVRVRVSGTAGPRR